jgi:hypothetical protein
MAAISDFIAAIFVISPETVAARAIEAAEP